MIRGLAVSSVNESASVMESNGKSTEKGALILLTAIEVYFNALSHNVLLLLLVKQFCFKKPHFYSNKVLLL